LYLNELDEASLWWKEQCLCIENEQDIAILAIIIFKSTTRMIQYSHWLHNLPWQNGYRHLPCSTAPSCILLRPVVFYCAQSYSTAPQSYNNIGPRCYLLLQQELQEFCFVLSVLRHKKLNLTRACRKFCRSKK
jgi:hypothetical protein